MLDNIVSEDEILYRAIKRSKPDWLDYGKPTSAMFRDSSGVSVDRDGKRAESEIKTVLQNNFGNRLKGAVKVRAKTCFEIGADVKAAPSYDNPFHANIWLDKEDRKNAMLQAYILAQNATVVFMDDSVEWT